MGTFPFFFSQFMIFSEVIFYWNNTLGPGVRFSGKPTTLHVGNTELSRLLFATHVLEETGIYILATQGGIFLQIEKQGRI